VDQQKLDEAFATLKSLLGHTGGGKQWENYAPAKSKAAGLADGFYFGSRDRWDTLFAAEETKLFALGLLDRPRLGRRHRFSCDAEVATKSFRDNCLGGMEDGNIVCLNQTLIGPSAGQRTLLTYADHVGRKIKIAYRVQECQGLSLCHKIRKPYTIVWNLSTCIWLDRPVEAHATGYLVLIFD
jgi:hypothetical protein